MKIIFLFIGFTAVLGRKGFGPTEQEWGHVTVRKDAHIFWWLHQTTADVTHYTERPLIIWLQGGPGVSSSGYGNFAEIGPLDLELNPRNESWVKNYNVLFVDNPVGTGFSRVELDHGEPFATSNKQIAEDFVVFLQEFYKTLPELKKTPLYIFSESYGAKMAVDIALVVDQAIKNKKLDINLVGIGLGSPWISPADTISAWGPYLLNVGVIDQNGYEHIQAHFQSGEHIIKSGDNSGKLFMNRAYDEIVRFTSNVNRYNILNKVSVATKKRNLEDDKIHSIMENQVKQALNVNVTFDEYAEYIPDYLKDYMKPVTEIVELLLNTTDIKVAIFNGQLDGLVTTPGTVAWVDKLRFDGSSKWKNAPREPIKVNTIVEGYYKKVGNLAMYWVNRAGHMIPADNPAAMNYILRDVTDGFKL